MKTHFTTTDIEKAIGIPRERLKDWMAQGFVAPSVPANGAGSTAFFTDIDLYKIQLFKELLGYGFKRKNAAELVGNMPVDFLVAGPFRISMKFDVYSAVQSALKDLG